MIVIGGGAGGTGLPMTGLGGTMHSGPPTLTPMDRNKAYCFGKVNSLLSINPHAITYAMVEVFCPYRLG